MHTKLDILRAALQEAPYTRSVGWDVFTVGEVDDDHDEYMIQRMDDPTAHIELTDGLSVRIECRDARFGLMDSDRAAELLVCLLACDGDREALDALVELGCTPDDLEWLSYPRAWWRARGEA